MIRTVLVSTLTALTLTGCPGSEPAKPHEPGVSAPAVDVAESDAPADVAAPEPSKKTDEAAARPQVIYYAFKG